MINALPEDLLVTILSFAPTRDAVATMFLSKQWRSIWTMIHRLEYKDDDVDYDTGDEIESESEYKPYEYTYDDDNWDADTDDENGDGEIENEQGEEEGKKSV